MPKSGPVVIAVCVAFVAAATVWAQTSYLETPDSEPLSRDTLGEFHFARLMYNANKYGRNRRWGGGRQMWQTDWPDAEYPFLNGIDRLTRIEIAERPHRLTALDEDIYDYPWIYAVEVGYWHLNRQEAARLREYLLRGGFLMVDDFHGTREWALFLASMKRVFPDRTIVDIPAGDETFHVVYDLDQRVQIPSRMIIYSGVTWEQDGYEPKWRGIFDDEGRLMVAINHNMDIGDAWEHADWPDYPENMTALAYRFGINYVVYAMTH